MCEWVDDFCDNLFLGTQVNALYRSMQQSLLHGSFFLIAEVLSSQTMVQEHRSFGYQECMADVLSYLSSVEGFSPSNPLYNRLANHLQKHVIPDTPFYHQQYQTTCYQQMLCKPEPITATYSPTDCQNYSYPPNSSDTTMYMNFQWEQQNVINQVPIPDNPQRPFLPHGSWV